MTREEAISWLVSLTEHEGEDVPIYDDDVEALNMAIEALEHPERNVVAIVPCGDCISRADVLQILLDYDYANENALVIKDIKALPSVTPQEPQSFKWCTDCKEYDTEKHCCHRYSKVIRNTVAEIRQEPVLDKIRAEIEQIKEAEYQIYGKGSWRFVDKCLDIIDKYKAESEPQKSEG